MPDTHPLDPVPPAEASRKTAARPLDRRRTSRDGVHGEPSRAQLVALILGTYAEMPGLTLHLHQAARLFGLRETTCLAVLTDLVRGGQLRQAPDGQYQALNNGGW
jgi:hypothetical protein